MKKKKIRYARRNCGSHLLVPVEEPDAEEGQDLGKTISGFRNRLMNSVNELLTTRCNVKVSLFCGVGGEILIHVIV